MEIASNIIILVVKLRLNLCIYCIAFKINIYLIPFVAFITKICFWSLSSAFYFFDTPVRLRMQK